MCIAIFKPRKTQPDWDAYETAYRGNPDGWGFAAARGGKLIVKKGVSSFNNFKKKFYEFRHCPAIVHFRIRTSGNIDNKNCHPFLVSPDLAFIHNGMLDIEQNVDKNMSDTWHFNRQVLRIIHEADPNFPWNLGTSFLGECFLGRGNKVVFLNASGEHTIWNRDAGHTTKDRHWWSNYSYSGGSRWTGQKATPTSSTSYYKNYGRIYDSMRSSGWLSDSKARESDAEHEQRDLVVEADDAESQKSLFDKVVPRVDGDPISEALGECSATDYEHGQCLAQCGLQSYVISELYKWWPESLGVLYDSYVEDTIDMYTPTKGESFE